VRMFTRKDCVACQTEPSVLSGRRVITFAAFGRGEIHTADHHRQRHGVHLDDQGRGVSATRQLEAAAFKTFDLGIRIRPFRSRYRICLRALGESPHDHFYLVRRFLGMTRSGCFAANHEVFLPASLRKRRSSSGSAQTIQCLPDGVRRW
jgi:hypothetical protein